MRLGAFRSLRGADIPADPVAPGSTHHQIEVSALEPSQFLGEQGHTLPPGVGSQNIVDIVSVKTDH